MQELEYGKIFVALCNHLYCTKNICWKLKISNLSWNHSYTSPAHFESSATPQNMIFRLFSIINESPGPPELRPGYQKWWNTSKKVEKWKFSNLLNGNHFYTSSVHSASSRHLKRCFSCISLHPIGSNRGPYSLSRQMPLACTVRDILGCSLRFVQSKLNLQIVFYLT